MTDIAKLNIEINSQKAVQAKTDLDQLTRSGQQAEKGMGSLSAAAKRLGVALAAAFSAYAVVNEIKKTIQAASDLEETMNKFNVVFRGMEAQANTWAKNLQENFAMSRNESYKYLASIQDLLVPMGMARDTAGQLANKIVQLSADLGSFNNLPTAQVMADIQSSLVGNYETMRKYGVILSAAIVEQEALNLGLARTKDELTTADKAQAAYNLMVRSSADAIGDMARSSDSYANQMKKLQANIDDFRTALGTQLLPIATEYVSKLNEWVKTNETFLAQDLPEHARKIADELLKIVGALSDIKVIYDALPSDVVGPGSSGLVGYLLFGKTGAVLGLAANLVPAVANIIRAIEQINKGNMSIGGFAGMNAEELEKFLDDLEKKSRKVYYAIDENTEGFDEYSEATRKAEVATGDLAGATSNLAGNANKLTAAMKNVMAERAEISYMEDWINLVKSGLTTQEATLEVERQKLVIRLENQGLNQEEIAHYLELLDVTDKLIDAEKARIEAADSKAEIGYMEDWVDLVKSGLTTQEATLEIERQKQVILYENQGLTQEEIAHYRELLDITDKLTKAEKDRDKATEDFNKKQEEARREYEREWERVYDDMHEFAADTFYDIFDGQLDSFEDFADSMLDVFKRMLANMAAEAAMTNIFKPMMNQMAGSALGSVFGLPSLSGGKTAIIPNVSGLPGMGWLGATIPGTAIIGSELGWGASAARNIGVMASPGVTWGSALGAGALGGLGYSTFGSAIGLPASRYSGLTAGLGAAGMSAYGGSLAGLTGIGALGGPIGIGIGASAGGLLGGLFGGSDPTPTIQLKSGLRHDSGVYPGEVNSPAGFYYHTWLQDVGSRAEIGSAVTGYFDSLFIALDDATKFSVKDVLSSTSFLTRVDPNDYDGDMNAILAAMSRDIFGDIQKNLEVALLGQDIEQINVGFFENMRNEGESLFDAFLRFSSVVENTGNFVEEFNRRVYDAMNIELGVTAEDIVAQIQLVSSAIAEMDMVISQLTRSQVLDQIRLLADTWNAYIEVMWRARATAEQLAEAEAKRNLVVGSQITGLTATSLQSGITGGGDISSIIENSLTQVMAGLTAESIVEKYITPLNEAVGKTWIDTGGDIEAVLAVIQGYDLGPAQDEINTFRDKIEEVFGTDAPEVIEEMVEDVRNSFEYLRTESELMIRLLEAQGKTEEAITLERQHEIEDLQRTWGDASGPLEELTRQIWNLGDAAQALSARNDAANAYLSALQSELAKLETAFESAKSTYLSLLNEEISAQQKLASEMEGAIDALKDYRKALSLEGTQNPGQRQAQLMLQQTLLGVQAMSGDASAVNDLIYVSQDYLSVIKDMSRNELEYAREVAKTNNLMEDVENVLGDQLSEAEQQIAALEDIVAQVTDTNETIKTIAEAQAVYEDAKADLENNWYADEISMLEGILENTKSLTELKALFEQAQANVLGGGGGSGTSIALNEFGSKPIPDSLGDGYYITIGENTATYHTPGGGSHTVSGPNAEQLLRDAYGFASGGSFEVFGPGGMDNLTLPQMRVTSGEMVNITRPDVMSGMSEELAALRAEVKQLREENRAHAVAQIKSSQAIERNTDYLESWDVNGLPAEEAAA